MAPAVCEVYGARVGNEVLLCLLPSIHKVISSVSPATLPPKSVKKPLRRRGPSALDGGNCASNRYPPVAHGLSSSPSEFRWSGHWSPAPGRTTDVALGSKEPDSPHTSLCYPERNGSFLVWPTCDGLRSSLISSSRKEQLQHKGIEVQGGKESDGRGWVVEAWPPWPYFMYWPTFLTWTWWPRLKAQGLFGPLDLGLLTEIPIGFNLRAGVSSQVTETSNSHLPLQHLWHYSHFTYPDGGSTGFHT